ncbi:MAG: hypothetical protein MJZ69_03345 [Bacteroidaceae bacterium]|nr:hypothetical protein [Candidatus Minthousia equi]MCQ2245808.1 hypothetical protein [Bacteroidaceae bacterium]
MKKLILCMMLLVATSVNSQAQDVYNYLYNKCTEKVGKSSANDYEVKKYDFELTALNYMKNHALKIGRNITTTFLDNQAYSLDTFLLRYLTVMKNTADSKKLQVTQLFVNATLNNPLFNDPDTDKTQAYIEEKGCITPFSIDTDWVKALDEIERLAR